MDIGFARNSWRGETLRKPVSMPVISDGIKLKDQKPIDTLIISDNVLTYFAKILSAQEKTLLGGGA